MARRPLPTRLLSLPLILCLLATACGASPRLPALAPGDVIVAFGDSLTYGTGAPPGSGYPDVLRTLTGRTVVAAGVPGEISAAARRRLPGVLARHRPRLVILCSGGNDLLRRVEPAETDANLRAMVATAREHGASVVLVAVPALPPVMRAIPYAAIARDLDAPLEEDVLGVVLFDESLKADALHPNAAGYRRVAEALAALLRRAGAL